MFNRCQIAFCFSLFPASLHGQDVVSSGILSTKGARLTLNQDFSAPPRLRSGITRVDQSAKPLSDPRFSWAAGYIWNHPLDAKLSDGLSARRGSPSWTSNGNADADPNGDLLAILGADIKPLRWSGTLDFVARKMPPDLGATISDPDPRGYLSASIVSYPYAQKYGVFAISAKLSSGKGTWPAFWLLPADKSWPPEIDIMEVIGREPSVLYTTVHTNFPKKETANGRGTDTHINLSASFHEYAVDWGPDKIDWYFDGRLMYTRPTPPDLHKTCYILTNLAVGRPGNWGGEPDQSTILPAMMQVAYIRVWQRPLYEKQVQ